ncbi:hypothetical protein T484DRAFT_1856615 [Baffinella frigidus]|nr:hypothetical protein T484DRAFT_1856615 [Cryptophyta sp. CCMP2293]
MDCARAGQEQEDEYGAVGLLQRFWDGSEEREEDEYGAVGLLQRFWDGSEDAAPRVEKAGLRRRSEAKDTGEEEEGGASAADAGEDKGEQGGWAGLLRRPEAGEGKGWVPRAALANERLLALAASWPERGLPAVQPLRNPSAPQEAAKAVYSSLYFQQRLAGILELALQTDARFLKGFWHPSGDVLREKAGVLAKEIEEAAPGWRGVLALDEPEKAGILAKDIEEAVPGWRGVLAADEPALQSLAEGWLSSLFVRLLDHLLSLESSRDDAPGGVEAATPATAARDARVMSYLCGVGVALAKDLQHGSRLDETVLKELRGEGGVSGLGEGGFAGLDEVLDAAGTSAAESLHS